MASSSEESRVSAQPAQEIEPQQIDQEVNQEVYIEEDPSEDEEPEEEEMGHVEPVNPVHWLDEETEEEEEETHGTGHWSAVTQEKHPNLILARPPDVRFTDGVPYSPLTEMGNPWDQVEEYCRLGDLLQRERIAVRRQKRKRLAERVAFWKHIDYTRDLYAEEHHKRLMLQFRVSEAVKALADEVSKGPNTRRNMALQGKMNEVMRIVEDDKA